MNSSAKICPFIVHSRIEIGVVRLVNVPLKKQVIILDVMIGLFQCMGIVISRALLNACT